LYCFLFYLEVSDVPSQSALLLIVKWGGQLTETGENQGEALGRVRKKDDSIEFI
jgi:hypothetical protein